MPDAPAPRYDWFVAHAGPDKPRARALKRELEALGLTVFLDEEGVSAGDSWRTTLDQAQRESRGTVLLLSENCAPTGAEYFDHEVKQAIELRRVGEHLVVPITLDDNRHDYGLGGIHRLDWRSRGALGLAATLHGKVRKRGQVPAPLSAPATVAVVAFGAEFGLLRSALAAELQALPDVSQALTVEAADDAALPEADLTITLVGFGCSGPDGAARLQQTLARPVGLQARWVSTDPGAWDAFEDDFPYVRRLQKRCDLELHGTLDQLADRNGDAVAALRAAVGAWLAAVVPPDLSGGDGANLATWERHLLDANRGFWEQGDATALTDLGDGRGVSRARIYVSLRAAGWFRGADGALLSPKEVRKTESTLRPEGALEQVARRRLQRADEEDERPAPVFLDEVLSRPGGRLSLVTGEAGSGKTVLLQHLAASLDARLTGREGGTAPHLDADALGADSPLAVPVPLLVQARVLAEVLPAPTQQSCLPKLAEALATLADAPDADALARALADGRLILQVDSLDEVRSRQGRARVVRALEACAAAHPRTRVILTSRPSAHTDLELPEAWDEVPIAPLDADLRGAVIDRWVQARALLPSQARDLRHAVSRVGEHFPSEADGPSPLANPLLLTVVLLVWLRSQELPDNLADLYDNVVRYLVNIATRRSGESEQGRRQRHRVLRELAATLQEAKTTALPDRQLAQAVARALPNRFENRDQARDYIDKLANDTGLLSTRVEHDRKGRRRLQWRFWHRSFQEYLAMRHLAAQPGDVATLLRDHPAALHDPAWTGAWRYALGAFGQERTDHERELVEALRALAKEARGTRDEARLWGHLLQGLADYGEAWLGDHPWLTELPREVAERYEANGADWPWLERRRVLDALGRLGDPRLGDPRDAPTGWVRIPDLMAMDREHAEGLVAQRQSAPQPDGLWVRRWPVTVAEYRDFVDWPGEASDLWDDTCPDAARRKEPDAWMHQRDQPNHPVVRVSWWQTRAFCRWAAAHWKLPGDGRVLDLPTSVEWELVARGTHGGPYPWGDAEPGKADDARANYDWGRESAVDRIDAVGAFPLGVRPEDGLWDLAGNVWEWTSSLHGDVEKVTPLGDLSPPAGGGRVLRGGSWIDAPPVSLRCAFRYWYWPGYRNADVGFRLVCRRSPSRPA